MGGFLGIGGSSAKVDRAAQLQSQDKLNSIFNWALPAGEQAIGQGQQQLGQASDYYSKLLTAGRTDTAQRIAPAINAAESGSDAQKKQAELMGNRSGGAAAHQAEADAKKNATIDQMISQALQSGQQQGAAGLEKIGAQEAAIGSNLFGGATGIEQSLLSSAIQSRGQSANIAAQQGEGIGALFDSLLGFL